MVMAVMAVVMAFVIVAFFGVQVHRLGRFRLGVFLDSVGRTQGFAFPAQCAE
jgi:hypothetical protein